MEDIHKIAPSFYIDLIGEINGIIGEIGNYIVLANLKDIRKLEANTNRSNTGQPEVQLLHVRR